VSLMSDTELQRKILEYIRHSEGKVPLFEIILRFRSEPFLFEKKEIIEAVEGMVGDRLRKDYLHIKCRLVPHYSILSEERGEVG